MGQAVLLATPLMEMRQILEPVIATISSFVSLIAVSAGSGNWDVVVASRRGGG